MAVRLCQDRLVINELLMLHLNNLLVSETRIYHISVLHLKTIGVTCQNWFQVENVNESRGSPFHHPLSQP